MIFVTKRTSRIPPKVNYMRLGSRTHLWKYQDTTARIFQLWQEFVHQYHFPWTLLKQLSRCICVSLGKQRHAQLITVTFLGTNYPEKEEKIKILKRTDILQRAVINNSNGRILLDMSTAILCQKWLTVIILCLATKSASRPSHRNGWLQILRSSMAYIAVRSLKTKDLVINPNELLLLPQFQRKLAQLVPVALRPISDSISKTYWYIKLQQQSAMQRVLGVFDILSWNSLLDLSLHMQLFYHMLRS